MSRAVAFSGRAGTGCFFFFVDRKKLKKCLLYLTSSLHEWKWLKHSIIYEVLSVGFVRCDSSPAVHNDVVGQNVSEHAHYFCTTLCHQKLLHIHNYGGSLQ